MKLTGNAALVPAKGLEALGRRQQEGGFTAGRL
jgi:hypothetical protein